MPKVAGCQAGMDRTYRDHRICDFWWFVLPESIRGISIRLPQDLALNKSNMARHLCSWLARLSRWVTFPLTIVSWLLIPIAIQYSLSSLIHMPIEHWALPRGRNTISYISRWASGCCPKNILFMALSLSLMASGPMHISVGLL